MGDKDAGLEAFDREHARFGQAMLDLDAGAAAGDDRGLDRYLVAEPGRHAEDGAGFDDRMADEFVMP